MFFTHSVGGEAVGESMADDPIEAMYALRTFGRLIDPSDFDEFVAETSAHDIGPIVTLRDLLTRAIEEASTQG